MLEDYISVVMSTRNPLQERTQKALAHLARSTVPYELILLNRNREWTTGTIVNQGIHASVGDHIMFLCDDCFVEPTTLEKMMLALGEKEVAIVGPMLAYPDGTLQTPTASIRVVVEQEEGEGPSLVDIMLIADGATLAAIDSGNMGFLTGACMMTRRDVIETIGGYDPTCVMGGGDTDFCFKARAAGYRIRLVEDAHAVHIAAATRSELSDRQEAEIHSMAWLLTKWGASKFIDKEKNGRTTIYRFSAGQSIDRRLYEEVLDQKGVV